MFTPVSSTMRFTVPKLELLARDRRSGAYPTKARTGDRTRSGKNRFYFDDTRTVVFATGTSISLPTTLHTGSNHLASDMASEFRVIGNVKEHAVNEWIAHRDLSEAPGPFIEQFQYEQADNGIVNSTLMTGSAYSIAPDRFKSKVSNKTIIRIEIPITASVQLDPLTSSIYYLNPNAAKFDQAVTENSRVYFAGQRFPTCFAALPFTPYGYHFLPIRQHPFSVLYNELQADIGYARIPGYAADGSDGLFYRADTSNQISTQPVTASVINPRHRANVSQSINLADYISHPFLLEKAVIEIPFAAGPGWMNDRFGFRVPHANASILDAGGPLITMALMRQDNNSAGHRDIIASATFTNVLDATSGSYAINSCSNGSGNAEIAYTQEGVGHLIKPSFVVTGTNSPSGSTNFFTGSVKLILEPAVTSHVYRMRVSGSGLFHWRVGVGESASVAQAPHANEAFGIAYGSTTKRTGLFVQTSRHVLGNHLALLDRTKLNGTTNPIRSMDSQFENIGTTGSVTAVVKTYTDIVSKSAKSPYLLHPEDDLIVCLNKHRAAGSTIASTWTNNNSTDYYPRATISTHDARIPTGVFRITLYGDLLKEDREFHDTLNQRLETTELWETIGEEPVLDQFDVTYTSELSASYLDRNNIFQTVPYTVNAITKSLSPAFSPLTSSLFEYARDIGNYTTNPEVQEIPWAVLAYAKGPSTSVTQDWLMYKYGYELQKSNRNLVLVTDDERYWDTRIPQPPDVCRKCNPSYFVTNGDTWGGKIIYAGDTSTFVTYGQGFGDTGRGIRDWYMTYPYESRYKDIPYVFAESLNQAVWQVTFNGNRTDLGIRPYSMIMLEVGPVTSSLLYANSSINQIDYAKEGMSTPEFIKVFFGIGDGVSSATNQYVVPRKNGSTTEFSIGADIRGWRYGMLNAFPTYTTAVFRRDRYGQFRDMLEQRLDGIFYDANGLIGKREGPVQVEFYDREGNFTDPLLTLSSNLSNEATSSIPYADGLARNRSAIDYSTVNITTVVL